MYSPLKFRRLCLVLLAVFSLLAAGCGDDDDVSDNDADSGDSEPDVTDDGGSDVEDAGPDLGTPMPAEGDPVTVGFISEGQSEAIDNSSELVAAEAAVEYINEYVNGAGGRVVELVTCETKSTPAGAQDCVAEMASAGAVAILNGVSGQAPSITAAAADAGIPFIQYQGVDSDTMGNENSSVITNGLSALAGPAKVAADAGDSKVGFVVIDVPAAADPLEAAAPIFFGNAGVEVEVVRIPPGTADLTPQIQAAIADGADHLSMIGDVTFCTSVLQAVDTLGFEGTITVIPQCFDENSADNVNTEGLIMPTTRTSDPADAEYKLFLDVMKTYAPDGATDDIAGGGFAAVVAFARAMAGHPDGEMNPDSVKTQLLEMEPAAMPLGLDESSFQCDRTAIAITPAICSDDALVTTLDAEGQPTGYEPLDIADLLTIG